MFTIVDEYPGRLRVAQRRERADPPPVGGEVSQMVFHRRRLTQWQASGAKGKVMMPSAASGRSHPLVAS
jgi:hypothetical protein